MKTIPILKSWSIFNIAQVEGEAVDAFNSGQELKTFAVDRSEFDTVVTSTNAVIDHGFEQAAFIPSEDRIIMPDVGRFDSFEDYAATTFHELGHWTQPSHRLGIEGSYAENELFAELTSSYLMASLGIPILTIYETQKPTSRVGCARSKTIRKSCLRLHRGHPGRQIIS